MLKRIDPGDAALGMFIHKLEGSWFKHPFWRTRFVLTDAAMLDRLRASAVDAVVIDTARGDDVALAEPPPPREPAPMRDTPRASAPPRRRTPASAALRPADHADAPSPAPEAIDLRSHTPQTLAREFGHATRIAERSKKAVSRVFIEARLGKTIKAGLVEPVINDIYASVQRNPHAFNSLMRCKRDNEYLYRHALGTSALMISLGRQLRLSPDRLREAGLAGMLLDIGVNYLSVDLAAHGGDYRRLEPTILRDHVRLGHDMLAASGVPEPVTRACLEHHERIDGGGYPAGLVGADISLLGRMAAICDHYDELVSGSDGGHGLDPAAALTTMMAMTGAFDPALLDSFIAAIGIYPIGALVLLRSDRLAMVIDQSASDPGRPKVRAFLSVATGARIAPVDIALDQTPDEGIAASVSAEAYGIADLPVLRERLVLRQK